MIQISDKTMQRLMPLVFGDLPSMMTVGYSGGDPMARLPVPGATTSRDPVVAEFLENRDNGILYCGTTSIAYSIEPTHRRFVRVAMAHCAEGEQFVYAVGRRIAIERLNINPLSGINLRLPADIAGDKKTAGVRTFLEYTFGSQYRAHK